MGKRRFSIKNTYYPHIDDKRDFRDWKGFIMDRKWVEQHGFYPFILKKINRTKYSYAIKTRKKKYRDIYLTAHIDSYIYQYYGHKLNNQYNKYVKKAGINKNAIAYRNCWRGKCNIHFAKEVFEFITRTKGAYVYVTDLEDFFGHIDHKYLKARLKEVAEGNVIDGADYAIFKNITRFSYFDEKEIVKYLGERKVMTLRGYDKLFDTPEKYRSAKKSLIHMHTQSYGIPQGTAISAVYSNIYMIEFDKKLSNYCSSMNGLYRRYCDDIIVVIPANEHDLLEKQMQFRKMIDGEENKIPNFAINDEKTNELVYDGHYFLSFITKKKCRLSYLGFDYDGSNVTIRSKSVFKYYNRLYRKIRYIAADIMKAKERQKKSGEVRKMITPEQIYSAARNAVYNGYTHLYSKEKAMNMAKRKKRKTYAQGNFITYAYKADRIFDSSNELKSGIKRQLRRHWNKVNTAIKGINPR